MADPAPTKRLALEAAWWTGYARMASTRRGGAGVIFRFTRVRPPGGGRDPDTGRDITPDRLATLVKVLRRWKLQIVGLEEALRRAAEPGARRFAVLSFDAGYSDVARFAAPLLARLQAPYTVFVPSGFVDGIATMWWLLLRDIVRRHDRISLVVDGIERHFEAPEAADKADLYRFLSEWMRSLDPRERQKALADLARRYGSDPDKLTRSASLTWDDVRAIAADPQVTIGSATVHYSALSSLDRAAAVREIRMGRQVLEAALNRSVPHFAFPFGDAAAIGRRGVEDARESGVATAVTAVAGVVPRGDDLPLHALPRIGWNNALSLRAVRSLQAGVGSPSAAVRSPDPDATSS